MTWPNKIAKYRRYVQWECKDIPPDLVLAVLEHESGGIAGRPGGTGTKTAELPAACGGVQTVDRAMGLMQVHPRTVKGFNERQTDENSKAFVEDIAGNDERSIRLQIRIGCFYLARCCAGLHGFDRSAFPARSLRNADPNQIALSLAGYAVGLGAVLKKLEQLKQLGQGLTYTALLTNFPDWGKSKETGKWINRPLHFAKTVYARYAQNRQTETTPKTAGGRLAAIAKRCGTGGGFILLPLAGAALWFFSKRAKNESTG